MRQPFFQQIMEVQRWLYGFSKQLPEIVFRFEKNI